MGLQSYNLIRRMGIVPILRLVVQESTDTRDRCLHGKKASQHTAPPLIISSKAAMLGAIRV